MWITLYCYYYYSNWIDLGCSWDNVSATVLTGLPYIQSFAYYYYGKIDKILTRLEGYLGILPKVKMLAFDPMIYWLHNSIVDYSKNGISLDLRLPYFCNEARFRQSPWLPSWPGPANPKIIFFSNWSAFFLIHFLW